MTVWACSPTLTRSWMPSSSRDLRGLLAGADAPNGRTGTRPHRVDRTLSLPAQGEPLSHGGERPALDKTEACVGRRGHGRLTRGLLVACLRTPGRPVSVPREYFPAFLELFAAQDGG